MQKITVNILVSVLSILLCLILAETGLRIFTSIGPRSGYLEPETALSHQLTPRTVVFEPDYSGMLISRDFKVTYKLNHSGFRERELDYKELSEKRPYLFTGDSFFHGWGVSREARITERFAELLRSQGIDAPVVNLAFPGFGTYQYLDILKLYAAKINPRLIVIGFFVGNDFLDDFETFYLNDSSSSADRAFFGFYIQRAKTFIRAFLRSSPVVNLIKYSLWEIRTFRNIFNKLEIKNNRIVLYEKQSSPLQDKFYNLTFAGFDELAEFSRTYDMPVLVVIIPDNLQVQNPELFAGYDFNKPQKMLIKHLTKLNIPYIDLLDDFLAVENPQSMHFREDKHWNEKGHEFGAKILFKYEQLRIRQK